MKGIINMRTTIMLSIVLTSQILSLNCAMNRVDRNEIIGRWILKEQASSRAKPTEIVKPNYFQFSDNDSFEAVNVPARPLFGLFPDSLKTTSGTGKWKLDRYQGYDVVSLEFERVTGLETGLSTRMLISKEFGSFTLFLWLAEEGGERIEYTKEKKGL